MKAVVINKHGSPEVLQYQEVEKPSVKPNQLLVKVHAASINPLDWKLRKGELQILTNFNLPFILGADFAGVVEAVGQQVARFKPGDEVFGAVNPIGGGAYAEYVAVSESSVVLKPGNITLEEAAAVPVAGVTALQALLDLGQLRSGQKVLINGASGGVGTFAVQVAKAMLAKVTGVCSTKNIELVESLGADVIDYNQQDVAQQATQYDIIFDTVDKLSFSDCEKILAPEGIYISTLPTPENIVQVLRTSVFSSKKAKIIFTQSRVRDLEALRELIEAGKIRSILDRVYPLSQAAEAHRHSETGRAVGKIILSIGQ